MSQEQQQSYELEDEGMTVVGICVLGGWLVRAKMRTSDA